MSRLLKLLFAFAVLFLLIGNSCEKETAEESSEKNTEKTETENPESEYYDGLDDALAELDELEEP